MSHVTCQTECHMIDIEGMSQDTYQTSCHVIEIRGIYMEIFVN